MPEGQGVEVSGVSITKEKVLGKLKGLKVDKSPGLDGLHPRVLKEVTLEIVVDLIVIFQESLVRSGSRRLENCRYYPAVQDGSYDLMTLYPRPRLHPGTPVVFPGEIDAPLLTSSTVSGV